MSMGKVSIEEEALKDILPLAGDLLDSDDLVELYSYTDVVSV
jgi:hypothetical protein